MVRYEKFGYVALNVTDVERSAEFYEKIVGLQKVKHEPNGPAFLRCSRDHHNVILYQSDRPGLKRLALEVQDPEQLEIAFQHFSREGLNPVELDQVECAKLGQGRTFRINEPYTKVTFEFYSDITQMATPYVHTVTKIARIGHVVIKVPEFEKTIKQVTDIMNFKVSDYVGDHFAFTRFFPNKYHHSLGIMKHNKWQFHHVNFMVSDIDDIGIARNRLIKNDIPIVYGPGRHAPSGSIFLYFLDPDGLTVEFSFGMEEFPEQESRKAKIVEAHPKTGDLWEGKRDPRHAAFGYIEGAEETQKV